MIRREDVFHVRGANRGRTATASQVGAASGRAVMAPFKMRERLNITYVIIGVNGGSATTPWPAGYNGGNAAGHGTNGLNAT